MALFSAVVVAAGASQRFIQSLAGVAADSAATSPALSSTPRSKVFIEWRGRPIFAHCLERLCAWIDGEIALVIRPADRGLFIEEIQKLSEIKDRIQLVDGGARRQDSVRNGLRALAPSQFVAIHDAARPVLVDQLWERLRVGVETHGAVVPVIRVTETGIQCGANGRCVKTDER